MTLLNASWFTDNSGSRDFLIFNSSSCTCFSNCSCALKKLPRCPLKSATTSLACPYASTSSIPCVLYSWYISQPLRIAAAAVFAAARRVSGSISHTSYKACKSELVNAPKSTLVIAGNGSAVNSVSCGKENSTHRSSD